MKQLFSLVLFLGIFTATAIAQAPPTQFRKAPMSAYMLDYAHTQKTWNNEKMKPGRYTYSLVSRANNEKKGKVNFDISVKNNNRYNKVVDKKVQPTGTTNGSFNITRVGGSGSNAYGMIKVHIGRAGNNTNVNYTFVIRRVGDLPGGGGGGGAAPCNSGSLGSKNGNVISNTVGKYTAIKKACKNSARVTVTKTGGKARTTILVYTSSSKNGPKQLLPGAKEFRKNARNGAQYINVPNANGKWIHVEVKNRSAGKSFKYRLSITQ